MPPVDLPAASPGAASDGPVLDGSVLHQLWVGVRVGRVSLDAFAKQVAALVQAAVKAERAAMLDDWRPW